MTSKSDIAQKQLDVVKSLNEVLCSAQHILIHICPHEDYTTREDPRCHQCNLCGVYLETDVSDGTGNVLVPHRPWQGKGS